MTPGLETDSEQNGEAHSRGFHPVAELTGLSIGFAAILLPICCVLADQILPLPTNQVIIGVAAPQPLRTEAPEIPGLDR